MCGIAALFTRSPRLDGDPIVSAMSDCIMYRGPDDSGRASFSNQAFLAHRRLSILDLSAAGHQPMSSPDKRFWIVYNGEIYNYLELKQSLSKHFPFRTETDTEVILAAFAHWGPSCLDQLNGMFAFCIYDQLERCFFVARDRFGIKPLYYWRPSFDSVAFASEIKQFTVIPGWEAKLHPQMVYDFLNWSVLDHTSNTLFVGVKQLRGGECLQVRLEDLHQPLSPKKWYTLSPIPFKGTRKEAIVTFYERFKESVHLHLRSDVPIGSCLSGGLDSSSIVSMIHHLHPEKGLQNTFSSCSHFKKYDERDYIDLLTKQLSLQSHFTYPELSDLQETLHQLVWHQDEPFPSLSIYAQWKVFQLARKHQVKVMLDGQGADESLVGYPFLMGHHLRDLFVSLKWKKLGLDLYQMGKLHNNYLLPLSHLTKKILPIALLAPLRRLFNRDSTSPKWLNLKRLECHDQYPWNESHRSLSAQCKQQLLYSNLPMLLHFEDRNSMAQSIEARVPYLDHRLVEFALGLPNEYKIEGGWTKAVLRNALEGYLPQKIRHRIDKMAFVTPEEHWMKVENPTYFQKAIERAYETNRELFTPYLLTSAKQIFSGQRPYNHFLWRVICFDEWVRTFSVRF